MTLLRFGVFELDLEAHELRRRGRLVPLPHQPFLVLARLASRSGAAVTREELSRLLWEEGVHVDQDRGLNHCINRVRHALGDDPRAPRFLETLPRVGYRFLADVEARADVLTPQAAPRPVLATSGRTPSRLFPAAIALLALFLQASGLPRHSIAGQAGLRSDDPEAQSLFARGRKLLDQGPDGWRRSLAPFSEATRRDPGFALAHYGLADAYMRMGENGILRADQAFPAARAAALAALSIEDRAEPLVILAAVKLNYEWDWTGAEAAYREALRLDPNMASARNSYARLLSAAGRHDEAIRMMGEVEAREPECGEIARDAGLAQFRAHRLDAAARDFRRWAALHPTEKDPHHWLALLYQLEGRLPEARREARAVLTMAGADPRFVASFDALPPEPAMQRYWRGSLQFLTGLLEDRLVGSDDFARPLALLGENESALDALERAADERSPTLLPALMDPAFDSLRGEIRFRSLLRRVGSPLAAAAPAPPALTTLALLR